MIHTPRQGMGKPRHSRMYHSCWTCTSWWHKLLSVDTACLESIAFIVYVMYLEFDLCTLKKARFTMSLKRVDEAHIHEAHSKLQWTGLGFPDGSWPICRCCRTSVNPGQTVRLPTFSLGTHTGQREGAMAQDFGYFSGRRGGPTWLYQTSYNTVFFYIKDRIAV